MQHRMFSCEEVEYNAILAIPRLYKENRADTLNALLSFWKEHCGSNSALFPILVVNAVKHNTFNETISWRGPVHRLDKDNGSDSGSYQKKVFFYLKEYRDAFHFKFPSKKGSDWWADNYAMPREYYNYYSFIKSAAAELLADQKLSPAETFLLRFFAQPDSVQINELDSVNYDGTVLKEKYLAYKKFNDKIHGFSYGIYGGDWISNGKLALLGNHPYLGFILGLRSERVIVDYSFNIKFVDAHNSYYVLKNDSLYSSKHFGGGYLGLDAGFELFRTRKSELDILAGAGYDWLVVLNANGANYNDDHNDVISKTSGSINLNAGLGYKFYLRNICKNDKRRYSYLSLQAKYNYINYKNPGGTDLMGNAVTIGLVYGGYSFNYTQFPYMGN